MTEPIECPYCGQQHHETMVLFDHRIHICPSLPPGTVYIDSEHETGPRGELLTIPISPEDPECS